MKKYQIIARDMPVSEIEADDFFIDESGNVVIFIETIEPTQANGFAPQRQLGAVRDFLSVRLKD